MIILAKFLFYVLLFTLTSVSLYNIAGIIFRLPNRKITKTLRRSSVGSAKKSGTEVNHMIAVQLSKLMVINEYKRQEMTEKLAVADIEETPEVFKSQGFVILIEFGIMAFIFYFIHPIMSIIPAVLGIFFYRRHNNVVNNAVKDLQDQMDIDLPRFVYSLKQDMVASHDVLYLLERHQNDYSDQWRRQMAITIADMHSGNYEAALQRLEGRVGSTSLSEVVRGLIEMSHGSDMSVYWESLQVRLSEMRKAQLRKQVRKIPDKIHNLSLWLIGAMLSIYIVVLVTVLVQTFGEIF